MRLAFVYLPELLLIIDFHADAIFKHILNMLLAKDRLPVFIRRLNDLLKVRGVAPRDLDRRRCLCDMGEDSRQEAIRLNLGHIVLDSLLLGVEAEPHL